ncbi:MAG TPA: sigma-70 family RNA polymerase sigma factor [Candidatus Polarisedimenticolia bacterium]|nr:sigma-70 family RNA polymerase sigma factor [Candidatus Polarisedimenticolia bacterium]
MDEQAEREILSRVARREPGSWEEFLEAFAGVLFRVACLFADGYDDRMDLFLLICSRLKEDDLKRIRVFRERPGAPCRFSTYLAVVAKNIGVDFVRAREGRYRPFGKVAAMDETDRLLFEYILREGRQVEEARGLLKGRHGITLGSAEAEERSARITATLSPNQRWKLLARLASRQGSLSIDPVRESAGDPDHPLPLRSRNGDPESALRGEEAWRILGEAMEEMEPRLRLALALKFRDGMSHAEIAEFFAVSPEEAEALVRDALGSLRDRLAGSGIAPLDLESAHAASFWPS